MQQKIRRKQVSAALLLCAVLLSGCAVQGPSGAVRAVPKTTFLPETTALPETTSAPVTTAVPETTAAPETTEAPETTAAPETTEALIDTAPPFFFYLVSPVTLQRGSAFDVHRYLAYADDLDAEPDLVMEGSVDTAAVGDYPLKLTLTDDAGNFAYAHMKVSVRESAPPTPAVELPRKSFAEFADTYQKDGAMVGIDVSKWQGSINFRRVAAAGCQFVIIRLGGYDDGLFTDAYFPSNLKNAKAAGLKVGVYWYSEENGPDMVRQNADYLYALLDGAELDFPIFFDWEDFVHFEDYKMSLRDLNEMFLAFREEAEARGYRAALYNSKYFLGALWSEEVKAGGVWLAHYTDRTNYDGSYFLWQQGLGRIDGIQGDVDVDVFYPQALS